MCSTSAYTPKPGKSAVNAHLLTTAVVLPLLITSAVRGYDYM